MEKVVRFGVSIEPDLLSKFDEIIGKRGYTNRSEAVRDLVRELIVEYDTTTDGGEVVGTITIIYDHDIGDVTNRLLHLQHQHNSEISSTMHIHVDAHTCLEVLVVYGCAEAVRKLSDNIRALRGVKHGELVMTSTGI